MIKNIINKILFGIEKVNKKYSKITLMTLKFSIKEYEKIKEINMLNSTAINVLHLINEYRKRHKLKNETIIHLVDDELQMIEKDTCGMYQLYFSYQLILFNPLEDSSVFNEKMLNKKTKEKLLNETLLTDK